VLLALQKGKAFSEESKMEYEILAESAGVSRHHLYKQMNVLEPEGLLIKRRISRTTYVWLTKKGAKWSPEKAKKSKKEKKKEKKEKKEKVEPIITKEDWKRAEVSEKAKDIKARIRERVKNITRLEHELKNATEARKKEIKDEIGVMEVQLSRIKREVPAEEAEKELKAPEKKEKPVEKPKATSNVKKERDSLKELVREYLLNIVVRRDDAIKYGMKSNVYKGYLLKMIGILAKTDEHWIKHNIRVVETKDKDGKVIKRDIIQD